MYAYPHLVDDLIPCILNAYDHWWSRDYTRLALVSPVWLQHIRKRLYARPALHTPTSCIHFARAVEGNPLLASLVQGIDLRPAVDRSVGATYAAKLMASLRRILTLPGICKVTFGGRFAVGAERFLQFLTHPQTITELCIDGGYPDSDPSARMGTLEWDDMTACRFVRLQALTLSNLELTVISWGASCGRLTSLELDNVAVVGGSIIDIMGDSFNALRSLRVCVRDVSNAAPMGELLCELTERCTALERLSYEHSSQVGYPFMVSAPFKCPSVRTLRLSGLLVHGIVHIVERCNNLEVLEVVGHEVRIDSMVWANMIASNAIPNLRQLTISPPYWYSRDSYQLNERYQPLNVACEKHGVALSLDLCWSKN
ncbi:hypothetical protein FOMPIDRAFT_1114243 [Fomitopsis schrenkii]|uniref:F-box domain-containing protein n=1 Tax=Fomitopsis schrenkii TaxID=2126942 RepID=S8ELL5_FOMSC|nr:hypothetical protein FOMPIDRAFT_1114243 [Fomitopsis schrenkii]